MKRMGFTTANIVIKSRRLCCVGFACSMMTAMAAGAPPTVEQVQQALDIAELAADSGLVDLSMKAVRRALESGPPTVSTATPPPTQQQSGARIDTSQPLPVPPVQVVRERIPRTIRKLVNVWELQAVPQKIYETLLNVVLAPGRPNEIFLYDQPTTQQEHHSDQSRATYCVAFDLIRLAKEAERLSELIEHVKCRRLDHSADAALLLLSCALETSDAEELSTQSSKLGQLMAAGTNLNSIKLAANVGMRLQLQSDAPESAANVLYAAGKAAMTISRYDSKVNLDAMAIALASVRSCFAAERKDQAIELLQLCLNNAAEQAKDEKAAGRVGRIRSQVARELYGRGQVDVARQMLGPEIAANFESRYRSKALLTPKDAASVPLDTPQSSTTKARVVAVASGTSAVEISDQIWICSLNTQSNESRIIFTLPDFQNVSAPVVSPDGTQIAFAATFPGEVVTSGSRIYIARLAAASLRDLGPGTLPSWSPSGRRLACSRYTPNRGVWLARVDNGSFQLLDEQGWAGCWSPDGRRIAYIRSRTGETEFMIVDLVEDETFRAATGRKTSTAQSSWNFSWTADSQHLMVEAFRGSGEGRFGVTSVNVQPGSNTRGLVHRADYFNADLAQSIDQSTAIFAPKLRKHGAERLHHLGVDGNGAPVYVDGQMPDRRNSGVSWMPDKNTLIYLSRPMRK